MRLIGTTFALVLAISCTVMAQAGKLQVGEIELPDLHWGQKTANFTIYNESDRDRPVIVETRITFTGAYLNPVRIARTNGMVYALDTLAMKAVVIIPGNFGKAVLNVRVYAVVDTLDAPLPGQQILSQDFTLQFHIPPQLGDYMQEQITVPPTIGSSMEFDNEFNRLLLVLIGEGRSVKEIADLAQADSMYVKAQLDTLIQYAYIVVDTPSLTVNFPIIGTKEAEEARALATTIIDSLTNMIIAHETDYNRLLDSLVRAGVVAADSNSFMNGGTILYRRYPTIGGMLLWFYLGQGYIAGQDALSIYPVDMSLCDVIIGDYMYLTRGGDFVNGHQFYNFQMKGGRPVIAWGDDAPKLVCPERIWTYNPPSHNSMVRYDIYDTTDIADVYTLDLKVVNAFLLEFGRPIVPALKPMVDRYKAISDKYRPDMFTRGARYWFWNLIATKTLDKLEQKGFCKISGTGQFRFEGFR